MRPRRRSDLRRVDGLLWVVLPRSVDFDAPPVHDPCTVAALIDPDLVQWREAFLAVELDGRWTRGTTVVDLYRRYPDQPVNAQVAMTLDAGRYWDLVLASVDALGRRE